MIDIHNHTLFGVDDGPRDLDTSLAMLRGALEQGVTDIICTPHYNKGNFQYPLETIAENFHTLQEAAAARQIPIALYLGCEYHVNEEIFANMAGGRTRTLADSNYILMEYSYETPYEEICEMTRRAIASDYIPVIAHAERYKCLATMPTRCLKLQKSGALIQCNADAVLGKEGKLTEIFCGLLLKLQGIDLIASDAHDITNRASHMKEAREMIARKYDEEYARWLFEKNPAKIIGKEETE